MKNKRIKILLFLLFFSVLLLPLIYSFMQLNRKIALKGAVQLAEKPELSLPTWLNGELQANTEKYINDNIGFRPVFVRLRNQVSYSLYGKAKAIGVIEGKEKYFYELNYIKAYNGTDFLGSESIKNRVLRLKELQDSLENRGKTFLICLAPGKGSFYPEFFPEKFAKEPTDSTNYKFYSRYMQDFDVKYIDFNRWFLQMKKTSKCILYPKYGIHWSFYGMTLATDSLIRHVEKMRDEDLPNLIFGENRLSRKLKPMDYDIADGMNLLFQLPSEPMCYPETEWESAENKSQPKMILVGDSFYWSMFQLGVWAKSFKPGGFWYYNRKIYPDSFDKELLVENINYREAISETDIVILLVTEANLPKFPWGFDKGALQAFKTTYEKPVGGKSPEKLTRQKELQKAMADIRANKKWMDDIRRKAKEKNISADSMLVLDATWMVEYKRKQAEK